MTTGREPHPGKCPCRLESRPKTGREPALQRKEVNRLYCNSPVLGGEKRKAIFCHRCRRAYPADTKSGIWFKETDKNGNVTDAKWECKICDSRWSGLYDYYDDYDEEEELYFNEEFGLDEEWE